ncbi:MAG: radical SAM protein [Candidatus Omnitrophota bacterium]|nr:radical SAM protein [Candidatus Omnitrophota bacterium]
MGIIAKKEESIYLENKRINELEIEERRTLLSSKPRMLVMVLTNRCNLKCIMCSRVNPGDNFTLPFALVERAFKLFPYLEDIDLQGGEVFLVDYFKDLFRKINQYPDMCKRIVTNGLLINQEWAKIFADSKNVELTYSIDAVTETTYEKIRSGAKFSELLKSIDIINKVRVEDNAKIKLRINAVVMASNFKELSFFPEFCKKHRFQHLRLDFLRPDVAAQEDVLLKKDNAVSSYLRRIIPEIKNSCQESNIGFEYTFDSLICTPAQKKPDQHAPGSRPRLKCKLPWKKLFIDTGGVILPDCLCRHPVGTMEEPIEEVWNNEKMQLYRQKLSCGLLNDWCSKACIDNAVDSYQLG